jgi:AcrR family transcriptional regulator
LNQPATQPGTKRRTASKKERKVQLIKATIRSIAKRGLSVTTMATVAKEAGLSQGIINLHFQSKERLLEETLQFVVDEYRAAWNGALENSGNSAVEKLSALVQIDFGKKVCQPNRLAVWFAFWGESRSRPTYRKICAARDREYRLSLGRYCEEIIRQGNYSSRADYVAFALSAITEGLWLNMLLNPHELSPDQAYEICMAYLHGVFPGHFGG